MFDRLRQLATAARDAAGIASRCFNAAHHPKEKTTRDRFSELCGRITLLHLNVNDEHVCPIARKATESALSSKRGLTRAREDWYTERYVLSEIKSFAKERIAELTAELDDRDSVITAIRAALTKAGIPEVEQYPDEPVDDWERSLRTGGRSISVMWQVSCLAAERDTLRTHLDWLTRWRSQYAEPCPFPRGTMVEYRKETWRAGEFSACALTSFDGETLWRPTVECLKYWKEGER